MPENTVKGVSMNTCATNAEQSNQQPAIQCSVQTPQQRYGGAKPKGNSIQVSGPQQVASNPSKGGTA